MLKVGYIGLGLMGKSIARNIAEAGFPLAVHNRSCVAVDELERGDVYMKRWNGK
ncbi:MAG: NAD(P)-binding domain-containing protein [Chloroflexota bacterium]